MVYEMDLCVLHKLCMQQRIYCLCCTQHAAFVCVASSWILYFNIIGDANCSANQCSSQITLHSTVHGLHSAQWSYTGCAWICYVKQGPMVGTKQT